MKNFKKLLFVAGFFFCIPLSSMAWGKLGHRIVGQIADSYLNAKAKLVIKSILGNESIAIASNWPDFIKSDSSNKYLSAWHYVDVPDSLDPLQLKAYLLKDTSIDAYTKLNFLIKELKNKNLSKEKQVMYLRFLIHIVGDIHQPFHVGRTGDLGGNKIKVKWFKDSTNLHAIWDDKLIQYQELSYTEYVKAINFSTKAEREAWQNTPIVDWFFESHQIAISLYNEITEPNQKLGYRYDYDHVETLNKQLLKAGVRLAGLLNDIFGS